MIIQGLNIGKINNADLLNYLSGGYFIKPSKSEFIQLLKEITLSIDESKFISALNALTIGLYFDSHTTVNYIKKKGTFRYSKYKDKRCIVGNLILKTLELDNKLFNLSIHENEYFKSILNLRNFHSTYVLVDKLILEEIKIFEFKYKDESLIKTLLTICDYLFLTNHTVTSKRNLLSLESRSKEDISSAISYLIFFISQKRSQHLNDTNKVSTDYIESNGIQKIIILACYVLDFREFEILIDHFNYKCIEFDNKIKIVPPNQDFEKSIRLGYIKSDIQSINDILQSGFLEDDNQLLSLEKLVDELYSNKEFDIFQYTESNNFPRYRIVLPEPILDFFINNYFRKNLLFKDEIIYLSHINKEQLLDIEKLESIFVKENLTLLDVVKIRRFFSFFYLLFTKKIFEIKDIKIELLYRSLIPVFKDDDLYNYLGKFTSHDKIDSFLDLICWEPDFGFVFDLQYQPILFINEFYLISLTIFHHSNFVRNLYASEYKKNNKHILSDGVYDLLVKDLSESFTQLKIANYCQTTIPNSDIDLFAFFDDTLYVFECKHTLHPVSSFDLRTTYDYIIKAEKQLDYIVELYDKQKLIPILENKYAITLRSITKVVCCIVLSNRIFNGNMFKYPVRYIHEIKNILHEGTLKTENGKFRIWKEDRLTNDDLLEYFSLKSRLVELMFNTLSEEILEYDLMKPMLQFETYYLDMEFASSRINDFTKFMPKANEE